MDKIVQRRLTTQGALPIRDVGWVEFAAEDLDAYPYLHDTIQEFSDTDGPVDRTTFRYSHYRDLLRLLSRLQHRLLKEEAEAIRCRFRYDGDAKKENREAGNGTVGSWMQLRNLFGTVGGKSVADYILHRHFTTYMQPIVQYNGTIIGYECLLRPLPEQQPFRPAELFETARAIGQHSFLDREARQAAVKMSAAHLSPGTKRFINFLPSSLVSPDRCLNGTFEAMMETGADAQDFVFEIVETERLDDPNLERVIELYREKGVLLAMDDVGEGFATLDAVDRFQPDYIKMDRQWVNGCERDSRKQAYIDKLLERASRFGGIVLAEGVEREEEWRYLRNAGVPLFQGYLFGLASPVPLGVHTFA